MLAYLVTVFVVAAVAASFTQSVVPVIPRAADGRPNLQGIWQAVGDTATDVGVSIPYQPWAAEKQVSNFKERQTEDPLANCYLPGVPRLMYMPYPFQMFQTATTVAIAFSWSLDFRIIYADGSVPPSGIDFWLGDSRGRWEGDTLVVDVTNHNDKTWFDKAGNFHGAGLHVEERYTLIDALDNLRELAHGFRHLEQYPGAQRLHMLGVSYELDEVAESLFGAQQDCLASQVLAIPGGCGEVRPRSLHRPFDPPELILLPPLLHSADKQERERIVAMSLHGRLPGELAFQERNAFARPRVAQQANRVIDEVISIFARFV